MHEAPVARLSHVHTAQENHGEGALDQSVIVSLVRVDGTCGVFDSV